MRTSEILQRFCILFTVIVLANLTVAQNTGKIPVTASKPEALKFYNDGLVSFEKAYLSEGLNLFKKAIELDSNFFMPHFQLAFYFYYFKNENGFKKYAEKAVSIGKGLNNAEEIYKQILSWLLTDMKADVSDLSVKITKLYPKDYYAWVYHGYFCYFAGKLDESIGHIKKSLEFTQNKGPVYNILGYFNMEAGKMDEAKKYFDLYIELQPNEPNPYDSKGDYYMAVKDYQKAYDCFMKAYQLNNAFTASLKKAEKVKEMIDSEK